MGDLENKYNVISELVAMDKITGQSIYDKILETESSVNVSFMFDKFYFVLVKPNSYYDEDGNVDVEDLLLFNPETVGSMKIVAR